MQHVRVAAQVSLLLHLPSCPPALRPRFQRVDLELWYEGGRLLGSAPLLLVPPTQAALAQELNAWWAAQQQLLHGGACQGPCVEFVDDLAFWLHAQHGEVLQQQDVQVLASMGLDLLDAAVREGMADVADALLELLLCGPYNL